MAENRLSEARNGHDSDHGRELPRRFTHLVLPRILFDLPWKWISVEAKLILAELDQLCTKKRDGHRYKWAWPENAHFERLIEREERTVRRALEELEARGLIAVEFETDPAQKNHQRRWISLNGRDLPEAIRQALAHEGRRSELTGEVAGQNCPPSPVNSDRRPVPDRRSELTAEPEHSLESEKRPCERKQQQADLHAEKAAGRIGGQASSPFPLGWEMGASRGKAAAAAGIDKAEKLPDNDGMTPLQYVLPEAEPGRLERLLGVGVAYSVAQEIADHRPAEWVEGWIAEYQSPRSTFKGSLPAVLVSKHRKGEDPPGAASSPPAPNSAARPADPEEKSHAVPGVAATQRHLEEMREGHFVTAEDLAEQDALLKEIRPELHAEWLARQARKAEKAAAAQKGTAP